ncbi:MAG: hypothetical protein ACRD0W_05700, partial [Acidimicrobiales bacterium]
MADALAALRQWGVEVVIGSQRFLIPPLPAVDWIEATLVSSMVDLLPDEATDALDELWDDDPGKLDRIFEDAVEAASGRPWYIATRLVAQLLDDQNRGEILSQTDISRLPFAAALDSIYAITVRWMDKDKRATFDAELNAPAGRPVAPENAREQAQ